jgi:hypothetical protein
MWPLRSCAASIFSSKNAKPARLALEARTGSKVVTGENHLPPVSAKQVRGATRLWDNSFDVHHANFQCRVVWPKGDQPSPKPFYLEFTAGASLLNPLASLVRRIGQRPKQAKKVLPFSFAASREKFEHRVVRRENIMRNHWPSAASR